MAQFNPDAPFADEPTRPVGRPRKVQPEPVTAPARIGLYDLSMFESRPTSHCKMFPDECRRYHQHDSPATPDVEAGQS